MFPKGIQQIISCPLERQVVNVKQVGQKATTMSPLRVLAVKVIFSVQIYPKVIIHLLRAH